MAAPIQNAANIRVEHLPDLSSHILSTVDGLPKTSTLEFHHPELFAWQPTVHFAAGTASVAGRPNVAIGIIYQEQARRGMFVQLSKSGTWDQPVIPSAGGLYIPEFPDRPQDPTKAIDEFIGGMFADAVQAGEYSTADAEAYRRVMLTGRGIISLFFSDSRLFETSG